MYDYAQNVTYPYTLTPGADPEIFHGGWLSVYITILNHGGIVMYTLSHVAGKQQLDVFP